VPQGGRLSEQDMEALDGAHGAVFAGNDHHIGVQVVLELYGFKQDSAAQRNLQGRVQVRGGRHPCSSKQQVSTDVQGASRAGGVDLEAVTGYKQWEAWQGAKGEGVSMATRGKECNP
jgi:hypothetical protein